MKKFRGSIKKYLAAALAAGLVITAASPAAVSADGRKVVTLGADLNEAQINSVLKYFGVKGKNVETIYITNQDERNMLGNYMPLEQIGTHTISCAYVQPTTSGGIHVKTANLNYVTSNMIASALSTSGVKNCDVIAAAPFEVSGTGALTGVMMAYEVAAGSVLSESKKQAASQELVTTGKIAEAVGQDQATKIVNDIKIKVIEDGLTAEDEDKIRDIVEEVVNNAMENITVSEEIDVRPFTDDDLIVLGDLAETIAEQNYDIEDMRETLARVEQNVSNSVNEANAADEVATLEGEEEYDEDLWNEDEEADVLDDDSILMNTDDAALGDDVIIDATNEEALQPVDTLEGEEEFTEEEGDPFEIVTGDENTFGEETGDDENGDVIDEEAGLDGETGEELNPNGAENFDEIEEFDETDEFAEGEEAGTDEIVEEELTDEASDAAAPEATFAPDGGNASFNVFSIKLYVNGNYVPASGTLKLYDSMGDEAESIDLSDTSKWGARTASEAGVSVSGYTDANEIQIFTTDLALFDSEYHASADITFKGADGAETAPVHVEGDLTFSESGVSVSDDSDTGFKTDAYISVFADTPEDAAYAEVYSSDPGVAFIDDGHAEGDFAQVGAMLTAKGDVTFTAEYFDADGNSIGSDSLTITVF